MDAKVYWEDRLVGYLRGITVALPYYHGEWVSVWDPAFERAFHDLQSEMLNDPPAVLLAFGETTRAVSRRFQPVNPPGGDIFRTITELLAGEAFASSLNPGSRPSGSGTGM